VVSYSINQFCLGDDFLKIAFFDTKTYDETYMTEANKTFNYTLKFFENKLTLDTVALAKGYDVVCAFVNDEINKPVVDELHNLQVKVLAMRCAGYNNVDLNACIDKLRVVRVPAYSPYAVAEHAFALMMTLNRKTHRAYNRTRESNFNINGLVGFDFYGKTLGIIGMGKIGQVLAEIGKGFGMEILAYDKYPAQNSAIQYVELEEIYTKSDILSLHCPLTPETHHMINENAISRMKEGIMIINTSRGGLIHTESLIEAIKHKKIGSAGLDVYEEEADYFFEDFSDSIIKDDVLARLLSFNNVLVTSHQAFLTKEALTNIATTTLRNIQAFEQGAPLLNEVCAVCGK
jgi:D-lactate dehydrogenase